MNYKAAVITASDSGWAGEREDLSGPAARELLEQAGYQVVHCALLPDDRAMLARELARLCDTDTAALVVTTGGTGFSPRDCTPEATMDVVERPTPGSPKAVRESLACILPALEHGLDILRGNAHNCAAPDPARQVCENQRGEKS